MKALPFLLLLAACGSVDVVTKPATVEVPIAVDCHTPDIAVPVWATTGVAAKDTTFRQAQALAATNEQRKAYEAQLAAASKACQ